MRSKALLTGLLMLLPLAAGASGVQIVVDGKAVTLNDVPQSAWYATYVSSAAQAGIVSGYKDTSGKPTGRFGPENSITIAESLKIAIEGAGYDREAYASKVPSGVNHWSSAYVSVAIGEKFPVWTSSIGLDRKATRAEVAALMAAAFRTNVAAQPSGGIFTDVDMSTNYATSIEALSKDGVVSGDTDVSGKATGTFRPTAAINRAEVAKMVMAARAKYGTPGQGRVPAESSGGDQQNTNTVSYGANGFTPAILHVKVGDTVTFVNNSVGGLRVASNPHPTHTDLPGFDSIDVLNNGGVYMYTFTKIGTWGYHNHLNPNHLGTVIVE